MAILHVRHVPDELYERIRERAGRERRSISGEVIQLLERALHGRDADDEDPAVAEYQRRAQALRRQADAWLWAHGRPQDRQEQRAAWAAIDAYRASLASQYGTLPDSTPILRADRERDRQSR